MKKNILNRFLFAALTLSVFLFSKSYGRGTFEGSVTLNPVGDSFIKQYRLESELIYRQSDGRVWIIPQGSVVDGRGFPRLFLDIFGEGLNSNFLKTAIVYDYAAKSMHLPWEAAQNMVFEGVQVETGSRADANLIFMLLQATGTRWATPGPTNCFSRCHGPSAKLEWRPEVNDEDVLNLVKWARDPSTTRDMIRSRVESVIINPGPHSVDNIR